MPAVLAEIEKEAGMKERRIVLVGGGARLARARCVVRARELAQAVFRRDRRHYDAICPSGSSGTAPTARLRDGG
jgi:hypothetical protein